MAFQRMLVFLVLILGATIQPLDAQIVYLNALDLPVAADYVTYFAERVNTSAVGTFFLPLCLPYNNGQFVEMKRQDLSMAYRAPIIQPNGVRYLPWNFTGFPVMTPRLSGVYRCYTSTAQSRRTYTLHVLVEPSLTCPQNLSFGYNGQKRITCMVRGYPQPSVTWTGHGNGNVTNTPPSLVDGVFKFNSTLTISVSSNMAAGVQMAVNLTAQLPAYSCTPGRYSSVQAMCQNVARSATRMLAVTISADVPTTPSLVSSGLPQNTADVPTTPSLVSSGLPQNTADVPTTPYLVSSGLPQNTADVPTTPSLVSSGLPQITADVPKTPYLVSSGLPQNTGFETAMLGTSLWLPIVVAFPVFLAAIAISIVVAKSRRDRLGKASYSCRHLAHARAATRNDAYEDAGRIDIRATGNPAYQLRASAPRQPGNTGAVVYEDVEIMESSTRNAAYTLTSVPNQPNYEFVL